MAEMAEIVRLSNRIIEQGAAWYEQNRVPLAFRKAHPLVLARAKLESGGDWRRCSIDSDGAIYVHNHVMWEPEMA